MTTIEFKQEPAKEKKTDHVNTAFGYFPANKPSPYTREGNPMTWPEVQDLVLAIMKEWRIEPGSTADCAKKLPALVFTLQQEIDTLRAEKQPKSKK